ncbi:NlpC/P60 domain protein [Ketogulonicigenium robustum]|uniref:NlpC/P60 domain protein n=1 Tax=Ketogulonicigenium robustum TaxID=92947 RepID=A0A1W6NWP5_9RHOB|nr:NlpC/P60 family protein [Ketogulonicigenium robustum]ARO13656.1 NlpC/P60 domain protein [Ketogulonicigenium robustum]
MDRRRTPANGRVAAAFLQGQVEAEYFVDGEAARVIWPVANLLKAPGGARDRQLLFGAAVKIYDQVDGWALVQADRDGYVGYVPFEALGPARTATHRVGTMATHVYSAPDIKQPEIMHLSLGAEVSVLAELAKFYETPEGFIPKPHLRPLDRPYRDPVTVAQMLFGVPYLWGGNSALGIDCSGTVQMAMTLCDIACPGDTDMQEAELGTLLPPDAPLQRGDLVFWAGHVALMVDEQTMIHANGNDMAVRYEGYETAVKRIIAQGGGPVTALKRI